MIESQVKKFLNIKQPILITGETGTGKSFLAQQIFNESKINKSRFITMHLASIKEELIESELFGHVKGSFSGAVENRSGYLADVGEGTLFLDEIGELSLDSQKKLLYLLEEKKFTPIGSSVPQCFKGRIILATNKNLETLVARSQFREDLYYRIKTFEIKIPKLNSDRHKVEKLIESLWDSLKKEHCQPYATISEEAKAHLINRTWKGNTRELKHNLEYALLLSEKNVIQLSDFPPSPEELEPSATISHTDFFKTLSDDYNESLELFEKMYLKSRFEKFEGRVNQTARILGISKTTLINKARKYQINTLKLRAEASEEAA